VGVTAREPRSEEEPGLKDGRGRGGLTYMVCALGEAWRTGGAARRGRGRRRRGRSRRGGRSGGTRPTPPTCRGCRRSPRRRTPSTTRTTSFTDPVARASRVRFLWFDLRSTPLERAEPSSSAGRSSLLRSSLPQSQGQLCASVHVERLLVTQHAAPQSTA
jgi:hypothetical protein